MFTSLRAALKIFFWVFAAYHAVVITMVASLAWRPLYLEIIGRPSHFDWQMLALKTVNSLFGLAMVWLMHSYLYRGKYVGTREDIAARVWFSLFYVGTLLNIHGFTFGGAVPRLGPTAALEFSLFAIVVVILVNARKLMRILQSLPTPQSGQPR